MRKRILVTGGAGFIGSHLCGRLVRSGHKVYCLDNFYTGTPKNIRHLSVGDNFEVIEHDVATPLAIDVDEIYNLACPASPVHYQRDPIRTMKTNVLGALHLLELAQRLGIRVLQASTSEVYGCAEVHPQIEGYWGNVNPNGVRSCYDEGKRAAESMFFDFHRQYATQIKVVRIFNTYGPNMHPDDGRVVSNFIVQALRGEDLTVYGDGSQTRSFCYVDDMVDGMLAMMHSSPDFMGPVNLGNPQETTMLELAELVLSRTKSKAKLRFLPLPTDDPRRRRPDISLARKKLGWEPKTDLPHGIDETIAYFRGYMGIG